MKYIAAANELADIFTKVSQPLAFSSYDPKSLYLLTPLRGDDRGSIETQKPKTDKAEDNG